MFVTDTKPIKAMRQSGGVIRNMIIGFLAIIFLLLILDVVTYYNYQRSIKVSELNMHSYRMIQESDQLLKALLNIETGHRGFMITGREPFLEPMEQGIAAFEEQYENMMGLTGDIPAHQTLLAALSDRYNTWLFQMLKPQLEERRAMAEGVVLDDISLMFAEAKEESKSLMDEMRALLREIKHNEQKLLFERQDQMMSVSRQNNYFIVFGMAVLIILSGVVAFLIVRNAYAYIRQRNQAEKELNTERMYFEQLFQSIPLGVVLLDRKDRVIDLNKGFADMFYYTREEAIGRPINDLIVSDEFKEQGTDATDKVASGQPVYLETVRRRKDGKQIDVAIIGNPVDMKGTGHLSVIGVYQDISERKRAEEILRKSEQNLRDLNADKDKFFSILAHDLRNPFNSIIGFSEVLIDRIKQKDPEGMEKFAQQILQSAKNTYELLTNLLAWARLQSGKMELNNEVVNLNSVLDESLMLFSENAADKSITLMRKTTPGIQVDADRTVLGTIMRNLINNAIKFTNPGGKVTIGSDMKNNEVLIWVRDTGIGMSEQMLEDLFDPGKNTSRTGTGGEPSTGLGLLLAKEFAEQQGGRLWAESTEGSGSVFYFSLPAKEYA